MIQKRGLTKFLVFITTLGVLISLILSAPAQAYALKLDILNKTVRQKENVNFTASLSINPTEIINVTSFILEVGNEEYNINCEFYPNGSAISGCEGLTIVNISAPIYGNISSSCYGYGGYNTCSCYGYDSCYSYGYHYSGYTNGTFIYNITLDTKKVPVGNYSTSFGVNLGNEKIFRDGDTLEVLPELIKLKDCSIRGKGNNLTAEGYTFSKDKLNFYVPLANAERGEGYLTGQAKRMTFNYEFKVVKVVENTNRDLFVLVSGNYRLGVGNKTREEATIHFDKINKIASISGEHIHIDNINVDFKKGC